MLVWRGVGGIFRLLANSRFGYSENSVASIVALRYVACPYCSTVYLGFGLGKIVRRVHTRVFSNDSSGTVDPRFRETHLANPFRCPQCGREFKVFIGVEADLESWPASVRRVHVVTERSDEQWARDAGEWPHKGLVAREVLEYTPSRVYLYESLEHYQRLNEGSAERVVSSMPADGMYTSTPASGMGPPRRVDLEG